jgi:hypothetical protein
MAWSLKRKQPSLVAGFADRGAGFAVVSQKYCIQFFVGFKIGPAISKREKPVGWQNEIANRYL